MILVELWVGVVVMYVNVSDEKKNGRNRDHIGRDNVDTLMCEYWKCPKNDM